MNQPDSVDTSKLASPSARQKDPVCGMNVNPAIARYQTLHNEKQYFFCSAGCLAKFQADPEKILSSPPRPMGSGFVSLGVAATGAATAAPKTTFPTATAKVSAPPAKVSAIPAANGPAAVKS